MPAGRAGPAVPQRRRAAARCSCAGGGWCALVPPGRAYPVAGDRRVRRHAAGGPERAWRRAGVGRRGPSDAPEPPAHARARPMYRRRPRHSSRRSVRAPVRARVRRGRRARRRAARRAAGCSAATARSAEPRPSPPHAVAHAHAATPASRPARSPLSGRAGGRKARSSSSSSTTPATAQPHERSAGRRRRLRRAGGGRPHPARRRVLLPAPDVVGPVRSARISDIDLLRAVRPVGVRLLRARSTSCARCWPRHPATTSPGTTGLRATTATSAARAPYNFFGTPGAAARARAAAPPAQGHRLPLRAPAPAGGKAAQLGHRALPGLAGDLRVERRGTSAVLLNRTARPRPPRAASELADARS